MAETRETTIPASDTPAAQWRENGEPDPFGKRYDCPRSATIMGHLSDDALANEVFMYDHRSGLGSIGYLTAAKDRIRWLSRALVAATRDSDALAVALGRIDRLDEADGHDLKWDHAWEAVQIARKALAARKDPTP
jgi:hypothetical protein